MPCELIYRVVPLYRSDMVEEGVAKYLNRFVLLTLMMEKASVNKL